MRAFKTVNDCYIEPISFIVPRRAEVFQEDIYPPAVGSKPAVSAQEWFGGKDGIPPKIDLESIFNGEEPTIVPAVAQPKKPSAPPAASGAAGSNNATKPAPAESKEDSGKDGAAGVSASSSAAHRGPPPSLTETKDSISQMASKFADKDDDGDDEDEDKEDHDAGFDEPPRVPRQMLQVAHKAEPSKVTPTRATVSGVHADEPDAAVKAVAHVAAEDEKVSVPRKVPFTFSSNLSGPLYFRFCSFPFFSKHKHRISNRGRGGRTIMLLD
jgi:coronin-1B/1C/6